MYHLIKQPEEQLRILFRNTAQKTGLHEAIVEKDFWVCLTLDYLFHYCPWKEAFTFKGGTSLSKCYGLIKRFSEDIDLILDWRVLGYGLNEPWEQRSNTKQDAFNKEANSRAEAFLSEKLLPVLKDDMGKILGREAHFYILPEDAQTICFQYPKKYSRILPLCRSFDWKLEHWQHGRRLFPKRLHPMLQKHTRRCFQNRIQRF